MILLLLAILLAYANSLNAPFVFDDLTTIVANESIRSPWPLGGALKPEMGGGETFEGRPLVNLSFALNYAFGELSPKLYHWTNLLLHASNVIVFYFLIQRVLSLPTIPNKIRERAWEIAIASSVLWGLHPLATSAVTYLSRRTDLLVSFFYLLVLLCVVQTALTGKRKWSIIAIAASFCGMASKETMASAPLIALLFDRSFLSQSFQQTWKARRNLYIGLASSWSLLLLLVSQSGNRGGTAGWNTGVSSLDYLYTQGHAIFLYLKLALWPQPLVFDYGQTLASANLLHTLQGLAVLAFLLATFPLLKLYPKIGFIGVVFFALLAPSSSLLPIATQPIAEHRMYLPLACIAILVAIATARLARLPFLIGIFILGLGLALSSASRNSDYATAESLWSDTIEKRPLNARAHNSLGAILSQDGDYERALPLFREATRLAPDEPTAHANLGSCLLQLDRLGEAIEQLEIALELSNPPPPGLRHLYATALIKVGRTTKGASELTRLLEDNSEDISAHLALANLYLERRQASEALRHFEAVAKLDPESEAAFTNLGNLNLLSRNVDEAIFNYRKSLEINPNSPLTLTNLGLALLLKGQRNEAQSLFESALRVDPNYLPARTQLQRLTAER